MKNFIFTIILFILFLWVPMSHAAAQEAEVPQAVAQETAAQIIEETSEADVTFTPPDIQQWLKDFRRFDIIAFGSFPFSMFIVNFVYDIFRWNNANGMDFSAAGRVYAPWPLTSAGAVEKTGVEFRNTVIMAVSLSAVFAIVDLIIFKNRQKKELNRIQDAPSFEPVTIIRNSNENAGEEQHPPDHED